MHSVFGDSVFRVSAEQTTRWLGLLVCAAALMACDDGASPASEGEQDAATATPGAAPLLAPDAALPDAEADAAPPVACTVTHRYDPLTDTQLALFPDDILTVADADSPSGRRLRVDRTTAPWFAEVPALLREAIGGLDGLSGFGTNGGIVLRFSAPVGPLPEDAEASVTGDALWLVDLGTDPPTRVPFEVSTSEGGATLVLQPLRPLRPKTAHAIIATDALRGEDGGCIDPSETTKALLTGEVDDARLAEISPRVLGAVEAVELPAARVVAAAVFTTHGHLDVLRAVADDVRGRAYTWSEPPTCRAMGAMRACEGVFEASDYRTDEAIDTPDAKATWRLPVSIWLPSVGDAPYPTLIFGHGIGDRRQSGRYIAEALAQLGIAVIAADALRHGEHPSAIPNDPQPALSFLGLNLTGLKVDTRALRGNFNQTTVDRLQLVELIRDAPDVDGDGAPDLDADRLGYWGISLGGMLGPSLLSLSDAMKVGVLSVAGGRLMLFVTDTAQIAQLRPVLENLSGGADRLHRLLPVAQALVDLADPAMYGPSVLHDRGVEGPVPHVLFPVAVEDEVVPPASGRALARAMGIPHMTPVITPVELIDVVEGPVSGNLDGTTAAYFQYDRITVANNRLAIAGHNNTPLGTEPYLQTYTFLRTWLEDEAPTILDPYAELGTRPLP